MDPTGGIQQIPSKKQFDFGGTIQQKPMISLKSSFP